MGRSPCGGHRTPTPVRRVWRLAAATALVWPLLVLSFNVHKSTRPPPFAWSLGEHRRAMGRAMSRMMMGTRPQEPTDPSAVALATASTPTPPTSGGPLDVGAGDGGAAGPTEDDGLEDEWLVRNPTDGRAQVAELFVDLGVDMSVAYVTAQRLLPAPTATYIEPFRRAINTSLTMFLEAGLLAPDVTDMWARCPLLASPRNAKYAIQTLSLLRMVLRLRSYDARRLCRTEPQVLLLSQAQISDTIEALGELGLHSTNLKLACFMHPNLLTKSRHTINRVCAVLTNQAVGFQRAKLGSLVRHWPWIFDADVHDQVEPAIRLLLDFRIRRIETVIRAYPEVLISDVETELAPRLEFLLEIGISRRDLPNVVGSFPLLLGLDVESRMRPVVDYLRRTLKIDERDVAKICRAFPSLLGLDCATHFEPTVAFLQQIGILNVARFVQRLPPVLGYDVESNLRPKWEYLTQDLQLSTYDVTRFPAYFSYPLERIVMPRTAFLRQQRQPTSVWSLSKVLTPSDDDFAEYVAKATADNYASFKASFLKKLERQREEQPAEQSTAGGGSSWLREKAEPAPPLVLGENLKPLPEQTRARRNEPQLPNSMPFTEIRPAPVPPLYRPML